MEDKYSLKIQNEINVILKNLNTWKNLFTIKLDYYQEGWAFSLREKNIFPRYIVIFKPYNEQSYSIKSFEIHFDQNINEIYKELYSNENIENLEELFQEIKEVVYGKDIVNITSKNYHENFLK